MEEGRHGALRRGAVAGNSQGSPAGAEEEIVVDEHAEVREGAGGGDHGVPEQREKPANSNTCCICHEPWASSGGHRVCCIPCGHVYGRSCLEKWLVRSGGMVAKCLWCQKLFQRKDMINLFGTTQHLLDDDGQLDEVAMEEQQEEEEAAAARQIPESAMEEPDDEAAMGDVVALINLVIAQRNNEAAAWNDAVAAWRDAAESWKAAAVGWKNVATVGGRNQAAAAAAAAASEEEAIMALCVMILLISCVLLRVIW